MSHDEGQGRRVRRVAVLAASAVMAVSGCAVQGPGAAPSASSSGSAVTDPPAGSTGLERFYSQNLTWEECGDIGGGKTARCAWVEVPVDYAEPDGETIKLRALKADATGSKRGSLLVNPGGPGGSAVEYARAADVIVSPRIRRTFDVVGLDPRGVGESAPIVCVEPEKMDAIMALDPTPDDDSEASAARESAAEFGRACGKKYPNLLAHVSTKDAARDMDVLRAALGEAKLTYLGKSYGTFLGATYAEQFPDRVGRLVLDGAIAPDLTDDEMNLGQATGFETATRAYVEDCIEQGDCPLGSDADQGMQALRDLLHSIDEDPLPVEGDARVKLLTEGWASTGMARALYDQGAWGALTDAIRAARSGDGGQLFELAREYADRDPSGVYHGNIMQAISAVNCADRPAQRTSPEQLAQRIETFEKAAPTWGESMARASVTCEEWPVKTDSAPHAIKAAGSAPVVVVGTTRDPATPYAWAKQLAEQLADGRLVTFDGDGHTAYGRSNSCVDKAVDTYLTGGKVPQDGLSC